MDAFTLDSPCDMHLHIRDHDMLKCVLPFTTEQFSSAIIMPNLIPPLTTVQSVIDYQNRITQATPKEHDFLPIMTLFYHENLSLQDLKDAKQKGIKMIKLYPQGITTNSENGAKNLLHDHNLKIFQMLEDLDFILALHGESNGFVMEREYEFLETFKTLAKTFPKLRLILEHVSDARSINIIESYPNTFGTITLHHLFYTLDDLLGNKLNPHLFCKPCLKTPKDQEALKEVALKAHSKFSFGSDSAPHAKATKECSQCGAGVFSAPVLLPALVMLFEKYNTLDTLQAFVSNNAQSIYGFTPPKRKITLHKKPFKIPSEYHGVVSLFANETLSWHIKA